MLCCVVLCCVVLCCVVLCCVVLCCVVLCCVVLCCVVLCCVVLCCVGEIQKVFCILYADSGVNFTRISLVACRAEHILLETYLPYS